MYRDRNISHPRGGGAIEEKCLWQRDGKGQDPLKINAKELNITNSDRPIYWNWTTDRDSDGNEVAKVVKTRWLEARGSFWTMNLSLGATYKVVFKAKMESDSSSMAGLMVNMKLSLPDGSNQERQVPLPSDHNSWTELEVGRFTMTAQNVGKVEFAMEKLFNGWRSGLMIKGVEVKNING